MIDHYSKGVYGRPIMWQQTKARTLVASGNFEFNSTRKGPKMYPPVRSSQTPSRALGAAHVTVAFSLRYTGTIYLIRIRMAYKDHPYLTTAAGFYSMSIKAPAVLSLVPLKTALNVSLQSPSRAIYSPVVLLLLLPELSFSPDLPDQ